jgi:cell division protein FtsB
MPEVPPIMPVPGPVRARRPFRPAHEVRQRRRRLVGYALLAGSCILMVNALLGENGYVATVRAQRDYSELSAALAAERRKTEELREQIDRIRRDPRALEGEARRQLGLIRPGETLVIIRDVKTAAGAAEK